MSPRLKRNRKVTKPPTVKGYKPYGPELDSEQKEPVGLLYEEYEALRLCDYDGMNHQDASREMDVSRPTFTRIYASVRQKIAKALVEGRPFIIEGGKVYFDSEWYHCESCGCYFNHPQKEISPESCPLCSSDMVVNYDYAEQNQEEARDECHGKRHRKKCGSKHQNQI